MKKIFCIFVVVLILIMATVPCFAYSLDNPDYQYSFESRSYSVGYSGFVDVSYTRSPFYFLGVGENVPYDNSLMIASNWELGHSYYISFFNSSPDSFNGNVYFPSGSSSLNVNPFYYSVPLERSQFSFIFRPSTSPSLLYLGGVFRASSNVGKTFVCENLNIVDVTVFVDQGFSDSEIISYLSNYYFDQTFSTGFHSIFLPGYFDPLKDFWLSFTHLFDYFGQLISTYSGLFVFVTICLSLCLVTFIVVMVIKRCRNI